MENLEESNETHNLSNSEARDAARDPYLQAIEIACSARDAKRKSQEADKKARYIEELSRQARQEADSLHDIAAGVTSTATSVAMVALQVCQYKSHRHAFRANPEYSKRIEEATFLEIVQPSGPRVLEPPVPKRVPGMNRRSSFGSQNSPPLTTSIPENVLDIDDNDIASVPTSTSNPSSQRTSPQELIPKTHVSDPLPSSQIAFSGTDPFPTTMRRHSLPTKTRQTQPSEKLTRTDSTERFTEKFPKEASPVAYKDSLASCFDSSTSMSPLWEDRYIPANGHGSGYGHGSGLASGVNNNTEKWADHKQKKQFQVKLKAAYPDSNSSVEMTSSDLARVLESLDDVSSGGLVSKESSPLQGKDLSSDSSSNFESATELQNINWRGKDSTKQKMKRPNLKPISNIHFDPESDSEVEEILTMTNTSSPHSVQPNPAWTQRLDQSPTQSGTIGAYGGQVVNKELPKPRVISPLLNQAEKTHVRTEERPDSPTKYCFSPPHTGQSDSDKDSPRR